MKTCNQFNTLTLSTAIAIALISGAVQAQEAPNQNKVINSTKAKNASKSKSETPQKTAQNLNQVVVTGAPTYAGVKRIDASFSITTANREEIKQTNPVSVADLLKISPGIYPESSGGQTGANIEVAGFPSDSGAPFVTFSINGSPLFPRFAYFEDAMFRLDDTIDRVEALQGGPSVLYGNGQPGLIANFILRQGTATPSGDIGVTYGSEGRKRVDGFFGFPLGNNWYGSIGGFWRTSDGVRDPQFPADKGGQLTATLAHDMDNGTIMFYARDLRDHNQFVTDTPIYNPSAGKFSPYPGFDPLTGTFGSKADRHQFFETTPCFTTGCKPTGVNIDLADGRGADIHMFGGNLDLSFDGGWSLSDKFYFTAGYMNTNAYFSTGQNPTTLASYISSWREELGLPHGLTPSATYTTGGLADMGQNVTVQNPEYIGKKIKVLSNELHLSKDLFEGNTLTVGTQGSVYSVRNREHDVDQLLQAKSNPTPIAVSLTDGTNVYKLTDAQGLFHENPSPYKATNEDWQATSVALFFNDSWKVGKWRFSGGARIQHDSFDGKHQNTTAGDLDADPYTLYNNNAQYLVDGYTHASYSKSAPSWTLGANYSFNRNMSAYARVNDGVFFPGFDNIRGLPSTPVEEIHNMEVGFKYQSPWLFADISAYRRLFYGVPYSVTLSTGRFHFSYGSTTKGINLQTTLKPIKNLAISLTGNYMDGTYSGYNSCVPYVAQDGSDKCSSIDGMALARQPKFQGRLTPAYTFPLSWGRLRFWVTYEYVGNRYSDQLEMQPLGQYHDISFGVVANIREHWQFSLRGTNITNQIGITEGNARLFGFASTGGVILARSIRGREVNFQAKYKF